MEVPAAPADRPPADRPPADKHFDPAKASPEKIGGDLIASRPAQIGWFLILALVSRISVFGDTNYFNDEYFYWQVGLRMHESALPYVDMWDRKGPGLFLTYWLAGFFGTSVYAYQTAALLAAAATGYLVNCIAAHFTNRIGAVLGGSLYLVLLVFFGGGGGQSPVFYNLPIALAALLVVKALPRLRQGSVPNSIYAAMASAGFAITFKQTAICEAAFLGLYVVWQLLRAKVSPLRLVGTALALMAAGAAPLALFAAFYALAGHFPEFWHAMVTANLAKTYNPAGDMAKRVGTLAALFSPAWIPALLGLLIRSPSPEAPRMFLAGWLIAGVAGVAVVPNFYEHYLLPLCLPISVAAARALGFRKIGPFYGFAAVLFILLLGPGVDFATRQASRTAMAAAAADIRSSAAHPRLLVYEGPVDLYREIGSYPPTPLYYPLHLYFPAESNVSHIATAEAMRAIIAWKPTAIVTYHAYPAYEENQDTAPLVHGYIKDHCHLKAQRQFPEVYSSHLADIWVCPDAAR